MSSDLEARLERLEAIEAARAVQARYADIIDRWSIDQLGEVFAPHAVLTAPNRRFAGIDAIRGFYNGVHDGDPSERRHFLTNVSVVAGDGQRVVLTARFLYVAGTGGESILGFGHYRDTIAIADGTARIVAKDIAVDHRGAVSASWADALHSAIVAAPVVTEV